MGNVVLVSADQAEQMRSIRDEVLHGLISWEQYGDRVDAILTGIDRDLVAEQEALQRFNNQLNDLQSQLASANGDDVVVENLRHKQKLADIEAETDLSTAQRRKLEQLGQQIHEANLKRIKAENDARSQGNQQQGGGTNTNRNAGGTGNGDAGGGGIPSAPRPSTTVNVTPHVLLLSGDANAARQLAQIVARDVKKIIDQIAADSR